MGYRKKTISLREHLVPRLEALRGVRSVAPVLTPPLAAAGGILGRIPAEGQSADEQSRNPALTFELVTPHYFTTFGLSLLRGRLFTDADREGSLPVAILSEFAARHYWPHADPIGKRLVTGKSEKVTVIGVVRDAHYRD